MGKFIAASVEDASLDALAQCTEVYFCTGQPADRAAAIATKCTAAAIPLTGADFSKANGATGVRVLTIAAKSATASVAQSNDHIAYCTGTALLYVATCAAQTSNVGAPVSLTAATFSVGPIA